MFTANTMASVSEAIGMALPGARRRPRSTAPRRLRVRVGQAVMRLLELDLRPRQIMTKEAFENAIAVVMALGGSTNAVLHLLAIANEARVELELDDFNRMGARVAHVADMKPHGKFHMADLDRVGGVQVVMKSCSMPTCCTVTVSQSPGARWPRTWPSSTRPPPTARLSTRSRIPFTRRAASPFCAARSLPRAAW